MNARKLRLAYLVTHPIQYQAPLLRRINAEPDIDLTVFFGTDFSARPFVAADFGQTIEWDVPLLEGYRHEVLPAIGPRDEKDLGFWKPLNHGLAARLSAGQFDALWVHGYARWLHWAAMAAARRRGIKVLLRDEATPISAARGPVKQAAKHLFFSGMNRLVDAYLAIGSLNRRYYVEHGVAKDRIFMVPYAVDNARFMADAAKANATREAFRAQLGLESGRPILLFAAKLIERKRPAQLIEAFATVQAEPALRRPYLVFAGDGPLRAQLERDAARLAPGRDQVPRLPAAERAAALLRSVRRLRPAVGPGGLGAGRQRGHVRGARRHRQRHGRLGARPRPARRERRRVPHRRRRRPDAGDARRSARPRRSSRRWAGAASRSSGAGASRKTSPGCGRR